MTHKWRRQNKKGKNVARCQGPYTPNGVSRKHPEFPKKPDDFPQQKYNSLFQKYCRIKGIKGRYEPDKIDEKRVAKRDKRLNAIIEMVTMSDNDSLSLRQENNLNDDQEIEVDEEMVPKNETLNSGGEDLEITKKSDKPKSMPFAVKKEETGLNEVLKLEIKSEAMPFDVKKEETEDQNGLNVALKLEIKQEPAP